MSDRLTIAELLEAKKTRLKNTLSVMTEASDIKPLCPILDTDKLNRETADSEASEYLASLTELTALEKSIALAGRVEMQRVIRDINIGRMSVQQRLLSGLSTVNKKVKDLEVEIEKAKQSKQ